MGLTLVYGTSVLMVSNLTGCSKTNYKIHLHLHYSYIAAALRLNCGCILELRMHYLHFSAAKFLSIDPLQNYLLDKLPKLREIRNTFFGFVVSWACILFWLYSIQYSPIFAVHLVLPFGKRETKNISINLQNNFFL
jgi:hypothetical protein